MRWQHPVALRSCHWTPRPAPTLPRQAAAAMLSRLLPPGVWQARPDARLAADRQAADAAAAPAAAVRAARPADLPPPAAATLGWQRQRQGRQQQQPAGRRCGPGCRSCGETPLRCSAWRRRSRHTSQPHSAAAWGCSAASSWMVTPQLLPLLLAGITTRLESPLQVRARRRVSGAAVWIGLRWQPASCPTPANPVPCSRCGGRPCVWGRRCLRCLTPPSHRCLLRMPISCGSCCLRSGGRQSPRPRAGHLPPRPPLGQLLTARRPPPKLTPRQQRREARAAAAAGGGGGRARRGQRARQARALEEAEGPLTETDSDDAGGSGSDASSLASSGGSSSRWGDGAVRYGGKRRGGPRPQQAAGAGAVCGPAGRHTEVAITRCAATPRPRLARPRPSSPLSLPAPPRPRAAQLRDLPKMLLSQAEADWRGQLPRAAPR